MNFSSNSPRLHPRPVATSLITIAIFLSGAVAFRFCRLHRFRKLISNHRRGSRFAGAKSRDMASLLLRHSSGSSPHPGVTQMTSLDARFHKRHTSVRS